MRMTCDVLRARSNTQVIAMNVEDLKDGRSFAEVAQRVSKKKPVVVLKLDARPWALGPPFTHRCPGGQ